MPIYPIKYIKNADNERMPVIVGVQQTTVTKSDGYQVVGQITSVNEDEEEGWILINPLGDVIENDKTLLSNNTFSVKAMDKTIKHLITRNHTKLMEFEYHRLGIKRYDLKFSDFTDEPRLAKKSESIYYPKRYTHYEYDRFIHENQRRAYRQCDVFNEPVNMLEIAARPEIFHRNFLIFIDGHLANTCEVYPLDDRLGFVIDVATTRKQHGLSVSTYRDYKNRDVDVTVFVVPNFNIGIMETNVPTLDQYKGLIPFSRISGFTGRFDAKPVAEPMIFFNDTEDLAVGIQSDATMRFEYNDETGEPESLWVNVFDLYTNHPKKRIVCIQFPYEMGVIESSAYNPCFELTKNQVPVPVDNFLPMRVIGATETLPSHLEFDANIEYHQFYPNIYAVGNVLSHINQLPVFTLTPEAFDAGFELVDGANCKVPNGLPEDTDIAIFEYPDNSFVLKRGIYTVHQLHIEYEDSAGELHIFPDSINRTIDVESATMRLFEEELVIKSVRFMGSSPEEPVADDENGAEEPPYDEEELPVDDEGELVEGEDPDVPPEIEKPDTRISIHPVLEPGDEYHEDTTEPGTDVVHPIVRTRVFYLDLDIDIELYHNDLKEYNWYRSLLKDYQRREVPWPLVEYTQEDFECSYEDYNKSIWMPSLVNYRFARLRGYLERYPNFIRTYIDRVRLPIEKYYIEMEGINLKERIRNDTYSENLVGNDNMEFDEPYYVFAMNRQFLFEGDYDFRLFLDGRFLANYNYITKSNLDFYYIYLKARMVVSHSILEIERFRLYRELHVTTLIPEDDGGPETITFHVDPPHVVQAREIYLAMLDEDRFLEPDEYKLEYYDKDRGEYVELNPTSCLVITGLDIKISLKNDFLYGFQIRYGVNQDSGMATGPVYQANGDELMLAGTSVSYTKVDFRNTGNFDDRSYRVFNNGRLCLPVQYYVKSHGSYGAIDSVRTRCVIYKGDQFTVDHTPSVYRVVYFAKEISEYGYLDLDGKIPLPLSLKYYDIYLNGLRLNRSHIEIISPTKCYIKNVESRQNFIIFERNHDDDAIFLTSFAYKQAGYSEAPMDVLIRELSDYKAWLDSVHVLINEDEKDQLEGGVISDDALAGLFVYGDILWNKELNCNKFNNETLNKINDEFPEEMVNGVFRIDSRDRIESATLYKQVNPNLYFEQKFGNKPIKKGAYRHAIEQVYLGDGPKAS